MVFLSLTCQLLILGPRSLGHTVDEYFANFETNLIRASRTEITLDGAQPKSAKSTLSKYLHHIPQGVPKTIIRSSQHERYIIDRLRAAAGILGHQQFRLWVENKIGLLRGPYGRTMARATTVLIAHYLFGENSATKTSLFFGKGRTRRRNLKWGAATAAFGAGITRCWRLRGSMFDALMTQSVGF